jgi:hypothetical protein
MIRPYGFFNRPFQHNSSHGQPSGHHHSQQMHGGAGAPMMMPGQHFGGGPLKHGVHDMLMNAGDALSDRMMMMMAAGAKKLGEEGAASNEPETQQDAGQFDDSSSSSDDSDVENLVDYAQIEFADLKVTMKPEGESPDTEKNLFNEIFNTNKNENLSELFLSTACLEEAFISDENLKSSLIGAQPNGYLKQWDLFEEFKSSNQSKLDKFFMFNLTHNQRVVNGLTEETVSEKKVNECELLEDNSDTLTSLSKELRIKGKIEKDFSHVAIKSDNEKFNQFNSLISASNSNACLKNCLSLLGSENLLMLGLA